MPQYQKGLLALSADPITHGHLDIVTRASERCTELLVLISSNPDKTYVLKDEERLKLAVKCIADFCPTSNVKVFLTQDILTDVFITQGCDVVFRGARDEHDMEYETLQTTYHSIVLPGIGEKTEIIAADPWLTHIQSTAVRHFARKHLDVTSMVPVAVQARLWRRMHSQKVIGITGGEHVGTTTVANGIKASLEEAKLPCTILDIADVVKMIQQDTSPGVVAMLKKLSEGPIFEAVDQEVEGLYHAHLNRVFRQEMGKIKGIVLVVWPFLVEYKMLHWVNNNVIVVDGPNRQDATLALGSNKGSFQIAEIVSLQQQDYYGTLIQYINDKANAEPTSFSDIGTQVCDLIRAGTI